MPLVEGVVVEKGSEYILAHTGPRELNGHPLGVVLCYSFSKGPCQHLISDLKIKCLRTNLNFQTLRECPRAGRFQAPLLLRTVRMRSQQGGGLAVRRLTHKQTNKQPNFVVNKDSWPQN